MTTLPHWYPGNEAKPAPMPLLIVQGFVNTLDLDEGTDHLPDAGAARDWFVEAGLLEPGSGVSDAELELARAMRDSIRDLVESEGGAQREVDLAPLRAVAASHEARLEVRPDGVVALEQPQLRNLGDGLFELLLIIRAAQEDGSWSRMKICGNEDCRWLFYDRSKNQRGHWCTMNTCGNRIKNRELRARRRG
jgi:predicted RNA-binding Zn ribbon-like protein